MIKHDFWSTQPCDMGTPVKEQDEGWLMLPMTFCGSEPGNILLNSMKNVVKSQT